MAGKEAGLVGLGSLPFEDLAQAQVVQAYLEQALRPAAYLTKEAQTAISWLSTS